MKRMAAGVLFGVAVTFLAIGSFIAGEASHGSLVAGLCTGVAVLLLLVSASIIFSNTDEIQRLRSGYGRILVSTDLEMLDGDLARDIATEMLVGRRS